MDNMAGMNYIGGRWSGSRTERRFEHRNPARNREVLSVCPRSDADDVHAAVMAARKAFPSWRKVSRIRRGEYLDSFAQMAKSDTEELARLLAKESGKPLNEARADVVEGIHTAQYWFGRSRMSSGEVFASEIAEKDAYMLRKPKGVVAAITPWNFPFAIPLWLACPSIMEGNTVVFKPAEQTPLIGQRIVELLEKTGLPAGVVNLVHGMGEEAGWPLVTHPEVDVVLFTGSYEVGSQIKQHCASDYRKMAACEMGGKNAMIICDDANMDLAVNAAILSAFKTSGQRCVSASRLLVQRGILGSFEQRFVEKARRLVIGDPLDERVFMGPLVSEDAVKKVERYNQLAVQEGARVLLNGSIRSDELKEGNFVLPFVYEMEHRSSARVLREEVFGPHVAIIPFDTIDDAVRIYNDSEYAFSMAVITNDYRVIRRFREECDFGIGYVNLPTIGAEVHLPFGGLKKSGTGMPSASALDDVITHRVAWTINHGSEIKMAQGLKADV